MIVSGLALGLASALCGGWANVVVTICGRRYGSLLTYVGMQLAALAIFVLLALVWGANLPPSMSLVAATGLVAIISTLTYLSFFTALRLGPVSVVSPIVGAYGGVAVVLAVVLLGERLAPGQAVAVVAAVSGVALVGFALDRGTRHPQVRGPGPLIAIVTTLGFAANVMAITTLVREYGWLDTLLVWRTWMAMIAALLITIAIVWVRLRPREPARPLVRLDRSAIGWMALGGALDAGAIVFLSVGLEVSYAWLVGLVSSLGPLSGALFGVAIFREHLHRAQWLGIGLVAASLVALAVSA